MDRESVTGEEGLLSTSQITWEVAYAARGARIRETVQVTSLVGPAMIDGTHSGTALVLDQLVAHLEA